MADALVDVQLVEGLALPYESGAEQYLAEALQPYWNGILALYPGLRLDPLFSSVDVATLADMVDVGRMRGEAPPDPFAWFEIPCDAAVAESVRAAMEALPFVEWAELRQAPSPGGIVRYGTNPESSVAFQLDPAPVGVDAVFASRIAGGTGPGTRVAGVEYGWRLDHEDLITASINPASVFGTPSADNIDHGTAVMGVLLGSDNGVGLVGVAPESQGFLVTIARPGGFFSVADALVAAGDAARPGGVVVIPVQHRLPWVVTPSAAGPALVPVEFSRAVQTAIRILVFFGITVVEIAGNSGTDLDGAAEFDHFNPTSSKFVDSWAIVVGGAMWATDQDGTTGWQRRSSYGLRVDCFAPFSDVRAPAASSTDAYQDFGGTSAASAIIAGVVCSMQGMSEASTGQPMFPTDIRTLLRDPDLGTPTEPSFPGLIRSMPDLRKIAARMGWARILPLAAMPVSDDGAVLVQIDGRDRLSRRTWTTPTGLGPNDPPPDPLDDFPLSACTPAVVLSLETAPLMRTVFEVLAPANDGSLRYFYWDPLGNSGHLANPMTPADTVARGYDVAASHPSQEIFAAAAITPGARLISLIYDATVMGQHGFDNSVTLDAVGSYRLAPGPVMVSRKSSLMDVVAVEDGGSLFWVSGKIDANNTPVWQAPVAAQTDIPMEPRVKPGLVGNLDGIAVVAVGSDGLLYSCGFGMAPMMFETLVTVWPTPAFARQGQIGLGLTASNTLVAAAVGADGLLYAAFNPLVLGGVWSPLIPVDPFTQVSPLGGATVVTSRNTVMIFAVLADGRACRSAFSPNLGWTPLQAG